MIVGVDALLAWPTSLLSGIRRGVNTVWMAGFLSVVSVGYTCEVGGREIGVNYPAIPEVSSIKSPLHASPLVAIVQASYSGWQPR